MKTSKIASNQLKNERGAAALGMAMVAIAVVTAISLSLPRYLASSSNATKDYRRQAQFQWILTQVGQIAYGAYMTGLRAGNCLPVADYDEVMIGTARFCFRKGTDARCVAHPQLSSPACMEFSSMTAQNSMGTSENLYAMDVKIHETFSKKTKRNLLNFSFAIYDAIGSSFNLLPSAHAFDDTFGHPAIPPTTATTNLLKVPICSGPPGDDACVTCSGSTICIRVRVCDPHKIGGCTADDHYYYQRIAIY